MSTLEFGITAMDFFREYPYRPLSSERPCTPMSNGEVKRHLKQRAIRINGEFPGPDGYVFYPIDDLVFFPNGKKRKCTLR